MAVTESSKVSVLRLKFAVGETSGGEIKYKRKDIKNVKADATKEDVYAVGKALSDLLEIDVFIWNNKKIDTPTGAGCLIVIK